MKIQQIAIDKIIPYVNNPKAHPEAQVKKIAGAIAEFKWDQPIVVDKDMVIIKGHGRLMAAQALGIKMVPVVVADYLTPAQVKAARIADNKVAESSWFPETLALELRALEEMDFDLGLTGFDFDELEAMGIGQGGDPPPEDPGPQIDRAAELQVKWGTKLGQVWTLASLSTPGKAHRVMCGDSTKAEDVGRLMNMAKVELVITDPPYGVSYGDKNSFLNAADKGNRIQTEIQNDHGSKEETQAMWKAAFFEMSRVMNKGAVVYCFMPQGGDQMMMMMMMMGAGIEPRHELIWLKNNHVLGRSDYNYKHEPILYAWKDGGHKFYGDFQTSILEFDKPLKSEFHPTMKPIELIGKLISNSSLIKQSIYDPFLGSGTTLIAAEQLGRVCFGCEIDPGYTAVVLERASGLGLEPKLIES